MKSTIKKTACLFLLPAAMVTSFLCGCSSALTLAINDMEIYVGDPATAIVATFSDESRRESISYDYDASVITIKGGKVTAKEEGVVTVTATTASCKTSFKVTCLPAREMISIADTYAWVGYPATDLSPVLADELKDETITYTYDESMVSIEGNSLTALKAGDLEVTATAGDYRTTFIVTCKEVDQSSHLYYINKNDGWLNANDTFRTQWGVRGTDNKTTIFIGDSFFDCRSFWTDFYEYYGAYDALCLGIGGTTSHTWEMLLTGHALLEGRTPLLKDVQAKNVVVNLGNNNIYNDSTETEQTVEDLERFYTLLHGCMPQAKLYIYSVTARNFDSALNPRRTVKETNAALNEWCASKDWITFIDLQDVMTSDKLKDNIHPKLEHYSFFVDALASTDIEIEEK